MKIYNLALFLTKNTSLIYLNLSNCSFKNLQLLSNVLTIINTFKFRKYYNRKLNYFNINNKSIRKNKGIIKINLSNNRLIDFDIYESSAILQNNTTLKYIDLSYNYINNINMLLKALQNNNTL